jgi:4-amino-4-deoxy-L-arabinose transferase-like glycosyltransferase
MGNDAVPETRKTRKRETLAVPLIILFFLLFAWLVYVYENRAWLVVFQQCMSWLANPMINYTSIQIEGTSMAFLATIEIIILGVLSAQTLLAGEKDRIIKFISSIGLGAGLTALITIILGIFGNLYQLPLNIAIMLLCVGFLLVNVYNQKAKEKFTILAIRKSLKAYFAIRKIKKPTNFKLLVIACSAIGIIFFFCFYHALQTVIVHWDSTVYHAVMPVMMYENHGFLLLAGPSIGIEMSANFPPLFPALGAYYYIQIGAIEDFYLRAVSPVMGLLTVLATYKIAVVLAGRKYGIIAALFLTITPLFFRYSVYATSYAILTFFGTVSVLFLFLAITRGDSRYWIMCGVFYGFALLTSYLAAYLALFFIIALIGYFVKKKKGCRVNMKIVMLLLASTLIIGGVWYLRNLIMLGNPVYPNAHSILDGKNIDPLILETTFEGIKRDALAAFFGGEVPLIEKIAIFFTYKAHFPAISLLTILGIALLPTQDKKFWLMSAWPLTLSAVILTGLTWSFPRHIMFAVPGFALLSAIPIVKALEKCEKYDRNLKQKSKNGFSKIRKEIPLPRRSTLLRIGIAIILIIAFLFPSLTFSMGGKVVLDNLNDEPLSNYLWFLENPNAEKWEALKNLIPDSVSWKWLNDNLKEGEKVATIENSIYYVKNSGNQYFFYLDGWEAQQLYNITDPALMLQFLRSHNVKYFYDVPWALEHGHLDILPMAQFERPPYFFKAVDENDNTTDLHIYSVGPVESPITANSPVMLSISQKGWSEPHDVNGVLAQAVIAKSEYARLYVDTPNCTLVRVTYLDDGTDSVSIHLYNPYSKKTVHDYAVIQRYDTDEWKTFEFLVLPNDKGYAELAFHAYKERDLNVSKIEAVPFQSYQGKDSLYSLGGKITNSTSPPTLMAYLPILHDNETIQVQTNSFGKDISVELVEGVIQSWETAQWWEHHIIVARSPSLPTYGQPDASLVWKTRKIEEPGIYTIVIMLRDEYTADAEVNLRISIVGTWRN